jgi:hypothetical protein
MARDVDLVSWWQSLTDAKRAEALEVRDAAMPDWMAQSLAQAGVKIKAAHRPGDHGGGFRVPGEVAAFLAEQI